MNVEQMLKYLSDLEENNDRQWYHSHKAENKLAVETFEDLLSDLYYEISMLEGFTAHQSPKDMMYRIPRDTRFTNDKRPYEPSLRAHISTLGKRMIPLGYFLHIQPGDRSFIGCGLHASGIKEATDMVREYLAAHERQWQKILSAPDFKEQFEVLGEKLKNPPRGYDKNQPSIEYLKHKSWYVLATVRDDEVLDPFVFVPLILEKCKAMKPFKDYLNMALEGLVMPERKRR